MIIHNGDHLQFEIENANTPPKQRSDWPLPSFAAKDWAEAFCKQFPQMDEGIMIAWFAGALMRGFDECSGRLARVQSVERAALESCESWLDRWTQHVGHCEGGDKCTCGRTAILYEARKALVNKYDEEMASEHGPDLIRER